MKKSFEYFCEVCQRLQISVNNDQKKCSNCDSKHILKLKNDRGDRQW